MAKIKENKNIEKSSNLNTVKKASELFPSSLEEMNFFLYGKR